MKEEVIMMDRRNLSAALPPGAAAVDSYEE
jgi:hypothetical protein